MDYSRRTDTSCSGYELIRRQSDFYLMKALFECLETCSWNCLTVSAIAEQAQISRRTFYRHFSGKEQMLEIWFAAREKEYLEKALSQPMLFYDPEQISCGFFSFWKRYWKELRILDTAGFDLDPVIRQGAVRIASARMQQAAVTDLKLRNSLPVFSGAGFSALLKERLRQNGFSDFEQ